MKKQFLTHDQLTEATPELRMELVEFCKQNKIYTWKQDAEGLSKLDPDEYNLPLFNYGQLLSFLLPKIKGISVETNPEGEGASLAVAFKDTSFGIINGGIELGGGLLWFEPIDALWSIILHYGREIAPKPQKEKKDVKSS